MPCENIKAELAKLRSEQAEAQEEFKSLSGSAKSGSPLRGQILALGKKIAAKDGELNKCLIANQVPAKAVRTRFQPETDGFLFGNNWTWDATEKQTLHKIMSDALGALEGLLSPILYATLEPLFIGIPFPFDLIALGAAVSSANHKIVDSITQAIEKGDNGHYGLCGGMTFAALDYWHKHWVVPQGMGTNDQPQRTTPQGTVLRNYIWSRLLKSVQDNAATFLKWMGMVHSDGGPKWLLDRTAEQLTTLRHSINSGRPVPIGLVGTTSNPFHNHQVLCYGFKDEGDGTTSLFIYDNNRPGKESVIKLDVRGKELKVVQDDTRDLNNDKRGPLRGLFCESYAPAEPPKAVVLRQGLATAAASAGVNQPVEVHYTAANVGYHTSAPIDLVVSTDKGALVGEASPTPIAMGGHRQMSSHLTFSAPGNYKVAVAAEVFAGPVDNHVNVVKVLPPETNGQAQTITVSIKS